MNQIRRTDTLGLIFDEWMKRPERERETREQAMRFLLQFTVREPEKTRGLGIGFAELLDWLVPENDSYYQ
jgi:hypothetical protein